MGEVVPPPPQSSAARTRAPLGAFARIAVFRALQLGDMLCAVPALRALRAALPQAHITLIGLPWAEEFARRFAYYVDGFLPFPGAAGLPERVPLPGETARFRQQIRAGGFDAVLQLHGSGAHSNPVVLGLGIPVCAGFFPAGTAAPDPRWFLPYPERETEVVRLLRLLEFLGIAPRGEALEFPISDAEWGAGARLQAAWGLRPGDYVCVHAGARAATRRWPAQRFARVADAMAQRRWRAVLTGSAAERELAHAVTEAMQARPVDLVGATTLGELAALLAGARLLICNDTGVSHLAAALGVWSVVIYSGSSPQRWAPADGRRHRRVFHPIDCRPCAHAVCPIGHPCADRVTVEEVVREAEAVLQQASY